MCGSDLPPYRAGSEAFRPIVRGHEPCGVIVAHGRSVTEDEAPLGQRVMIHHYSGCGRCKHCRVGYAQMCLEGNLVYARQDGGVVTASFLGQESGGFCTFAGTVTG